MNQQLNSIFVTFIFILSAGHCIELVSEEFVRCPSTLDFTVNRTTPLPGSEWGPNTRTDAVRLPFSSTKNDSYGEGRGDIYCYYEGEKFRNYLTRPVPQPESECVHTQEKVHTCVRPGDSTIKSQGQLRVSQSQTFFIYSEPGQAPASTSFRDFWYNAISPTQGYIQNGPSNPAFQAAIMPRGSDATYTDCKDRVASSAPIAISALPPGTELCLKARGKYSKIKILRYQGREKVMVLSFKTWWDRDGHNGLNRYRGGNVQRSNKHIPSRVAPNVGRNHQSVPQRR